MAAPVDHADRGPDRKRRRPAAPSIVLGALAVASIAGCGLVLRTESDWGDRLWTSTLGVEGRAAPPIEAPGADER